MRVSHVLASIVGFVGCFALWVTSSFIFGPLGSDMSDTHAAVWLYTPYAKPGQVIRTKIRVSRGEACGIVKMAASIDGHLVAEGDGPGKNWGGMITRTSSSTPSSERELPIPLDPSLEPGPHDLKVEVTYAYADSNGSGFANKVDQTELTTKLEVPSSTLGRRLFSLLRALLPALLVWLLFPRIAPRTMAWANAGTGNKAAGAGLGTFFIVIFIAYCLAGYPGFALPIAAALGTPDFVIVGSMFGWVALPVLSLFYGRRVKPLPQVVANLRFVDAVEPADNPSGYRDGSPKEPPKRAFAPIAKELWSLKLRATAEGFKTKNRRMDPVVVEFEIANPNDLGKGFTMRIPMVTLVRALPLIARATGPFDVEVKGVTMRVDRETSVAAVRSTFDAVS